MLGEAMREESLAEEAEQLSITPVVDPRFEPLDPRFHAMLGHVY